MFQDGHFDLSKAYQQIESSLDKIEIVSGAPTSELTRQVDLSLSQNQLKVQAIHRYVNHILTSTPRTSADYKAIYGVTQSERDVLPLLNKMQEHCHFFDRTVLPKMMRVASDLSHYSLNVQASYQSIIEMISEKNLREQLQPINETMILLIHDIVQEATIHQQEALIVQDQILQMLEDSKNDKQSLVVRIAQVAQEHSSVSVEVSSINRLISDLEKQNREAHEEMVHFQNCLGIQAVEFGGRRLAETNLGKQMEAGIDKAQKAANAAIQKQVEKSLYLTKLKELGEGAYKKSAEALEQTNQAINNLEERILQKCGGYPVFQMIKTQGGKAYTIFVENKRHIITALEVMTAVYYGTSAYKARTKRDGIIQQIIQKTDALAAKNIMLANLLRLQTDLGEISSLLEEALFGFEFMSVSWKNIVIDLNGVLSKSTETQSRERMIQVKADLKTAISLWDALHVRVEKFRKEAFLK